MTPREPGAVVVRELVELTEHFLMERVVLAEHTRSLNERLRNGETVMVHAAPVAPAERGEELLRLWVEAAKSGWAAL